jgi:predicted amidohydrolase YtcJ
MTMTRKKASGYAALACFGVALAGAVGAQPADRIWTGGPILTMNDEAPRAEAVAERAGRIVAVGPRADVLKLRGPGTQVIDLNGRALLPGFIDAHGHVTGGGMQALAANLLAPPDGAVKDIASLLQTMRDWIGANEAAVGKINLIVGFGYDNSTLAERRHPTREDLDRISRDVPILLVHQSSHLAAVNSKALEVGGITAETPDPAGGVIRRQAGSRVPDGVLEETAAMALMMKLIGQVGPEGMKTFLKAGADLWARFGYTTAQDGASTPGSVAVMREVAGGKLVIDGSPQGFTAWRDRPYYKPVGEYPPGYSGYPSVMPDDVVDHVGWAFANDVQVLAHANGEAAMDALIAGVTLAQLKHGAGKDRRPVLIHGQFMREDQVDAFKRLDVIPSLFPMHTFYWGDWHMNQTVGPQLGRNISPTGWVRKRGMIFTTHHDAPVAFPDSMRVLDATVTRRARGSGRVIGPQQRVDVMTALKAMTLWPAIQYFEESRKGSLEVGKLADFVILSADPTRVAATSLAQIRVTETIKEGAVVYRRTPSSEKRAALAAGPDRLGDNAFSRFLAQSALYADLARLPPYLKGAGTLAYFRSAPHDSACVSRALVTLMAAMAGDDPVAR